MADVFAYECAACDARFSLLVPVPPPAPAMGAGYSVTPFSSTIQSDSHSGDPQFQAKTFLYLYSVENNGGRSPRRADTINSVPNCPPLFTPKSR